MTDSLIGRPLTRTEDARLVSGRGRYLADLRIPGALEAVFVRSPIAHGTFSSIDAAEAIALEGVDAVFTSESLPGHSPLVDAITIEGLLKTPQMPLTDGTVRYVGEPVAIVVARDRYVAEDALALIDIDYEILPVVTNAIDAAAADATLLFPQLGTNVVYRETKTFGDPDAVLAGAHRVYSAEFHGGRLTAAPLETRGCIAAFDAGRGELTMWSSTQGHHLLRRRLATTTGIPENKIRVIVPDVGGGFGQKIPASPEEIAVALAAVALERPVRWVEDRRENLQGAPQAKEQIVTTEIGVDEDGNLLAMRARVVGDSGAFSFNSASALIEPYLSALLMPSVYRIEHFECEIVATLTNKSPVSPYRGVGWTASHTARELLIDEIARDRGRDAAELRRANMIPSDELPYTNVTGMVFDSGSYRESLDEALRLVDYTGFKARQIEAREEGRYLGVGISPYVEPTGWGSEGAAQSHWAFASFDSARVTMDPSGQVTVAVGAPSQGQGHETTLAQLAAETIGLPIESVSVRNDDTAATPASIAGTRASRTAVVLGGAIVLAAEDLKQNLRRVAAHLLEAAHDDVVIEAGKAFVVGDAGSALPISRVAAAAHFEPAVRQTDPEPMLSAQRFHDPKATYSNGCIVATVEVDVATGGVDVRDIIAVEDCGRMINPLVVDGQVRGAAAQGLGCALLEDVAYDADGQVLTGTFMDYLLPTATDVPPITIGHIESPSPHTVLGIKGMGESGMIATPAAIANAVADAIGSRAPVTRLPLTPDAVGALVDDAGLTEPEMAAALIAGAKGGA